MALRVQRQRTFQRVVKRVAGRSRHVIDLTDPSWEYDVGTAAGETAIRSLLVERVGSGWDLCSFEPAGDTHRFIFKRPLRRP